MDQGVQGMHVEMADRNTIVYQGRPDICDEEHGNGVGALSAANGSADSLLGMQP